MKILFIDPYPDTKFRISKDQNGGYGTANNYGDSLFGKFLKFYVKESIDFPPLYAVQTIGELININHEVKFVKNFKGLNDISEYDFFIITSSIVCHETEIEVIKELTTYKKNIFSIGPFATSNPQNYINAGSKVISGEPEMFFHKFNLSLNELNLLPNLINNFKSIDINDLSIPGWEVIFKLYTPKFKFLGNQPAVNINASRGCPYSCFYYCVYPLQQGRKLRLKNPDKLINEIKYLQKTLNVSNFIFRDPVFSIDKKHTIQICKKIISEKLNINICIETHLKNIDDELTNYLKKAGVKLIYVGIESSNEDVKKTNNRWSEENNKQIKKVNYLEKQGIKVKAMYIVGLPGDTHKTFEETLKYAKKINSFYAQFSVFTPYPGTPVYNEYKNKMEFNKFEDFTQWDLVFKHPNFSKKDIRTILDKSYQSYYLRPRWLLKFALNKLR